MGEVLGKVGPGRLHQRRLAALPPHPQRGFAGPPAPPCQQDQQVFQMNDQLLPGAEGYILPGDGQGAGFGGRVVEFRRLLHQPVQVVLLPRFGMEHHAPEPVHGRCGAVEVHAQHLGRDLPHAAHGKDLLRLVQQNSPCPQYHPLVVAAFLHRAGAHIDQLPPLGGRGRNAVLGAALPGRSRRHRLDAEGKILLERHSASFVRQSPCRCPARDPAGRCRRNGTPPAPPGPAGETVPARGRYRSGRCSRPSAG